MNKEFKKATKQSVSLLTKSMKADAAWKNSLDKVNKLRDVSVKDSYLKALKSKSNKRNSDDNLTLLKKIADDHVITLKTAVSIVGRL